MLLDMLEGFKGFYSEYGDAPIVENYPLKDGLYIKVGDAGIEDSILISNDAGVGSLLDSKQLDLINWFRPRDYLSILPLYSTNKAVDSKSVHSNNCFTMFIRKQSILKKGNIIKKTLLNTENYFDKIEEYFSAERFAKTHKSKQADRKILELAPEVNLDLFNRSKSSILELLKKIDEIKEVEGLKNDEYIRIFYNADIEEYRIEYIRYMLRKVFNKSKYHVMTETGEVVGLHGINIVTNPKKPSLELKSMKCVVPIRINFGDALLLQKLYDFLYFYKVPRKIKKENEEPETVKVNSLFKTLYIPYDWNIEGKELTEYTQSAGPAYYIRTGMGTSFSILDYDIIMPFEDQIEFEIENVLKKQYKDKTTEELKSWEYPTLNNLKDLESYIDYAFFGYKLSRSYFEDNIKADAGLPKNIINLIHLSKGAFYNWFKKGNELEIRSIISKLILDIICEYADNAGGLEDYYKLVDMMNLRIALLKYFDLGGDILKEDVNEIKAKLENILYDSEELRLDNDKEFFYLAGQLAYFISAKDGSLNKKLGASRKYLHTKSVSNMKDVLISGYEKYSHKISMYDIWFKKLFDLIISYTSDGLLKKNKDFFLAGFLSENLLFQPRTKEKAK